MTPKHLLIFVSCTFLTMIGVTYYSSARGQSPQMEVIRIYFTDRSQLDNLESQGIDLFEEVTDTYAVGQVTEEQKRLLLAAGLKIESAPDIQRYVINFYPACYKNYSQMKEKLQGIASTYPNLTELMDIGDSWEKTQDKADRDLYVLKITNKNQQAKKPKIFIEAEHHAREIATPELALALINKLVTQYGMDADITWLVDFHEIYVMPMANPDGHTHAEKGESWRKNTNDSNGKCPGGYPPHTYGIDLNRNYNIAWGGASRDPCHQTYQGPNFFSETETKAIRDFVAREKPNLAIDLHSYSRLVMYPWSWTREAPKDEEGLKAIANKFASYNGYRAGQISRLLYIATGSSADWYYDKYNTPSFVFEIGTTFTPTCEALTGIINENLPALIYALRISQEPYTLVKGPDATDLKITSLGENKFKLEATITDQFTGGQNVSDAYYYILDNTAKNMTPKDGKFDSPTEKVEAEIDSTNLKPGEHTVFVYGTDTERNTGPITAIYLKLGEEPPPPPPPPPPPRKSIELKKGWNRIPWTSDYKELEAKSVPESVNEDCGDKSLKAVAQLKEDFYEDFIPLFGGVNFKLAAKGTYWLRLVGPSENCEWTP